MCTIRFEAVLVLNWIRLAMEEGCRVVGSGRVLSIVANVKLGLFF